MEIVQEELYQRRKEIKELIKIFKEILNDAKNIFESIEVLKDKRAFLLLQISV